jgi:flagellar assembly factor FliW
MVRGFPGFENQVRFIIVSLERHEPFKWLQSLEDPKLAFLIIDPLYFKPDYAVEINKDDLLILKAGKRGDVAVFVLVSIPRNNPESMSANLLAPLLVNRANMNGAQLVLGDSGYSTDYSIFGELATKLSGAAANGDN